MVSSGAGVIYVCQPVGGLRVVGWDQYHIEGETDLKIGEKREKEEEEEEEQG